MSTDRHSPHYKSMNLRLDKEDKRRLKKFARLEKMTEVEVIRHLIRNHCVSLADD